MMYKEMKTFELNYPVIHFFVISISLFFLLEGKVELATHLEIFIWFQFSYPFLLSGHIKISALYFYSHLFPDYYNCFSVWEKRDSERKS